MSYSPEKGFHNHFYNKVMKWYRETPIYIPLMNESARMMLRVKYFYDRQKVAAYCRNRNDEIEAWYRKKKLFFGFAYFRSGTVFLTNIFRQELERSQIEHEVNIDDYWNYPKLLVDYDEARNYIRDYRLKDIFYRAADDIDIYAEINPYLRLHCLAIKEALPAAKLFHLIRDPRDVIRSIMTRATLEKKDPFNVLIRPPEDDPYHERWNNMTKFERLCWQWQYDNRFIRKHISHCVHFESMVADYEYFKETLLDFLGVEIPQDRWLRYVSRPINATQKHMLPHWKGWDRQSMDSFNEICGQELAAYGYG